MEVVRQIYYQVRYIYRKIQRVKTWQLIIVLILVGFLTATFLRLNRTGMIHRYEAVLAADKEARDDDIANRMYDLQRYVAAHMNTSTGQFELEHQYERDVQKALAEAIDESSSSNHIHAEADRVCAPQFTVYSPAYMQCFLDEIDKHPPGSVPDGTYTKPSRALYRHSFASPRWSPDFAGFSLLFFMAIALIIVGRWLHFGFLYLLLKLRHKGIGS